MIGDIVRNLNKQQLDLTQRIFMLALGRTFQTVFEGLPHEKKSHMEYIFKSASIEEKIRFIKKESKHFQKIFQKSLAALKADLLKEVASQKQKTA